MEDGSVTNMLHGKKKWKITAKNNMISRIKTDGYALFTNINKGESEPFNYLPAVLITLLIHDWHFLKKNKGR